METKILAPGKVVYQERSSGGRTRDLFGIVLCRQGCEAPDNTPIYTEQGTTGIVPTNLLRVIERSEEIGDLRPECSDRGSQRIAFRVLAKTLFTLRQ